MPVMPIDVQNIQYPSSTTNENGNSSKEPSVRAKLLQLSLKNNKADHSNQARQINRQIAQALSKHPLQFINLIDDCIEHILRELSFQDLVHLASTCDRFQYVVPSFFIKCTKKHELIIDCDKYPRYTLNTWDNTGPIPRKFFGTDFPLFIFGFHEVIKKLTILNLFPVTEYEPRHQNDPKIERLVAKIFNKRDNLRELTFIRCGPKTLMAHDTMEFHVGKVSFDRCHLGQAALKWGKIFPKMHQLTIIDCHTDIARECIENPLNLKSFELDASHLHVNNWFGGRFTEENVQRFMDENSQLKKLGLCYWNEIFYSPQLLKYAAEHLPLLQSLQLRHLQYANFCTKGAIDFPSVRKFTLSNECKIAEQLQRNLANLTFPMLQKFYLLGYYDAECVSFLARHQTIRKFVCHPFGLHDHYPTDFDIKTFANVLPQLETLLISGNCISSSGLLDFIAECKTVSLIKIRFCEFSLAAACAQFEKDCMQRGWNVSYKENLFKIVMKKVQSLDGLVNH